MLYDQIDQAIERHRDDALKLLQIMRVCSSPAIIPTASISKLGTWSTTALPMPRRWLPF